MRVIFTDRAEWQLAQLQKEITLRSGFKTRAQEYVRRIIAYCERLATFPARGSIRNEVYPGLRTIGFERRVTIAFIVTEEAVFITGIFYGGQDIEAAFLGKPE